MLCTAYNLQRVGACGCAIRRLVGWGAGDVSPDAANADVGPVTGSNRIGSKRRSHCVGERARSSHFRACGESCDLKAVRRMR